MLAAFIHIGLGSALIFAAPKSVLNVIASSLNVLYYSGVMSAETPAAKYARKRCTEGSHGGPSRPGTSRWKRTSEMSGMPSESDTANMAVSKKMPKLSFKKAADSAPTTGSSQQQQQQAADSAAAVRSSRRRWKHSGDGLYWPDIRGDQWYVKRKQAYDHASHIFRQKSQAKYDMPVQQNESEYESWREASQGLSLDEKVKALFENL